MDNYICIGDIHGRYDLLAILLDKLFVENPIVQKLDAKLVFLGDMVDRGPDSFKVVAKVKQLCDEGKAIAILGNHEDMMFEFFRGRIPDRNHIWLYNGGAMTIESYAAPFKRYGRSFFFKNFAESGHAAFLKSLPYFYETDKVWFSHAPIPNEETKKWLPLVSHIKISEGDFRANKDLLTWTYVSPAEAQEGTWEHKHEKLAVCGHIHKLRENYLLPRIYDQIIYADTGSGCAPQGPLTAIIIEDGVYKEYIQALPGEIK